MRELIIALRRDRVDVGLALFLTLFTVVRGLLWIGVYPALKIVDEPAHFDSIQYRAEHRFRAPHADGTAIDKVISTTASNELRSTWQATQALFRGAFMKGHFGSPHERALEIMASDRAARLTSGQSTALSSPSGYYAIATLAYRAFSRSSVLTRIFAVRTASLLWAVLLVVCTFVAARCVLPSRLLGFTAAFLAGLQPVAAQQTCAINTDAAVIGLGALAFCLQMVIATRMPRPPLAAMIALAITMAVAVETKAQAYALVPGCLLLAGWLMAIAPRSRRHVAMVGGSALLFFLVRAVCSDSASGYARLRAMPTPSLVEFVSWLWTREDAYWAGLFRTAWGSFSWQDVTLADAWLVPIHLLATLTWLGMAAALVRRTLRPHDTFFWRLPPAAFALFTAAAGFLVVLFLDYFGDVGLKLEHAISGRTFLVVLPAAAIVATVALSSLVPRRLRPLSALLLVVGALLLATGSILTVLRYHYVS